MIRLLGHGKYVPPHAETNQEVAARFGIPEEEIVQKSGIRCRYLARDEAASSMALKALREALEDAALRPEDLDGVLVATYAGDYTYPNVASRLARELGIHGCFAFDVQANCAGFQVGLGLARDFLLGDPRRRHVAVVGVAKQSPFLDPNDLATAFFFSDAAAAAIVGRGGAAGQGLLPSMFLTNGQSHEMVRLRAGGSSFPYSAALREADPKAFFYEHAGLGVWSEVMVELPRLIRRALEELGWEADDVDLYLFHQANLKLLQFVMARLRIPLAKTLTNVQDIGNTADASLGTVLHDAARAGLLARPGTRVLLASVGAGFVYCVTPYVAPDPSPRASLEAAPR